MKIPKFEDVVKMSRDEILREKYLLRRESVLRRNMLKAYGEKHKDELEKYEGEETVVDDAMKLRLVKKALVELEKLGGDDELKQQFEELHGQYTKLVNEK